MRTCKINYNGRQVSNDFFGVAVKSSERAKAHSRRFPTVTKRKSFRVIDKIKVGVCVAIIASAWFMCWKNNQTVATTTVEAADEDPGSALPKWKVFTSHDTPAGYTEGDLFDKYFGKDARTMRAICQTESGMQDIRSHKPNKNGTYDWGRCQINEIHAWRVGGDVTKLLDSETNVKTAKAIFDDREAYQKSKGLRVDGFEAWSMYTNGEYKKNL